MFNRLRFPLLCLSTLVVLHLSCVSMRDVDRAAVEEADRYAEDGLLKEASEKYRIIIQHNDKNLWAKRNLGLVQLRMRDYTGAIVNLEAAANKFSSDYELNYSLAEAHRTLEKYPEAIFRYQRALELSPRDGKAAKGIAWSYYKLHYFPEALASIRQYRPKPGDVDDGQRAVIEARILVRMDRYDDALRVVRQSKQSIVEKSSLAYLLSVEGEIFAARGDCASANKVFRDALKRQPLLAGPLLGLGKCFLRDAKPELAIEYLERAVRIRPSLTEGYLLLSEALSQSDKQRSLKYFKKFRQLALNDPDWQEQLKAQSAKLEYSELSDSSEFPKARRR